MHVERDEAVAKVWLDPVGLAYSRLYPPHELRKVEGLVRDRRDDLLEAWNDFFGG